MKKNNKLSKVLMLLTSFQTILLGLFFIIQVLRIYYGSQTIHDDMLDNYVNSTIEGFLLVRTRCL